MDFLWKKKWELLFYHRTLNLFTFLQNLLWLEIEIHNIHLEHLKYWNNDYDLQRTKLKDRAKPMHAQYAGTYLKLAQTWSVTAFVSSISAAVLFTANRAIIRRITFHINWYWCKIAWVIDMARAIWKNNIVNLRYKHYRQI